VWSASLILESVLIGIAHEHVPIIPCRYDVRRGRAIEELLANWRAQGIDRITIAQWKEKSTPGPGGKLKCALEELDIRSPPQFFNGQAAGVFCRLSTN